jgi:hypothetical protein
VLNQVRSQWFCRIRFGGSQLWARKRNWQESRQVQRNKYWPRIF